MRLWGELKAALRDDFALVGVALGAIVVASWGAVWLAWVVWHHG